MPDRMNQVQSEEKYQPHTPVPCFNTPVFQRISHNQCLNFFQGGPITLLPERAALGNTLQYHREALNYKYYCVPPMPVGFSQGPVQFLLKGTEDLPESQQPSPIPHEYSTEMSDSPKKDSKPTFPGTASDLTAYQLRNPSSSLPQGVAEASAQCSYKPLEEALQKRELRLMKNREAARECRRKKKEYVKCLENRVAVLENQNKTLIEELRALKDVYRHKVE